MVCAGNPRFAITSRSLARSCVSWSALLLPERPLSFSPGIFCDGDQFGQRGDEQLRRRRRQLLHRQVQGLKVFEPNGNRSSLFWHRIDRDSGRCELRSDKKKRSLSLLVPKCRPVVASSSPKRCHRRRKRCEKASPAQAPIPFTS